MNDPALFTPHDFPKDRMPAQPDTWRNQECVTCGTIFRGKDGRANCAICLADRERKHAPKGSALSNQIGGVHYKDLPIQPVEFCQKNKLNYCEANAIKYLCRHRDKGGREDLEKAKHYIDLLLEIEYPEITEPEYRSFERPIEGEPKHRK
jgi:hypothetical protein